MKLSELRKTEAVVASESGEGAQPSSGEQPWGVKTSVTPNGVEIYYQAGPKRLYRVRERVGVPGEDAVWTDWQEVPSASEILEVLEKGGLSWWGMKVGIAGVGELLRRGTIGRLRSIVEDENGVETVVELLKQEKLTVNHVKGQAADRGTNVHTALELYADSGVLPDPELYPENERGYVAGLVRFLKDAQPEVEHSELMVASPSLGYAGRFDLIAKLRGGKAVVKCYPKRPDLVDVVDPELRILLDLKTSKDVYESYHLQVAGYEGALDECGYAPVDKTAIVRVTKDGKYELVYGRAVPSDFFAVFEVWKIVNRIRGKS